MSSGSDILLAKPVLPDGHIDVSVGEAYVVRQALEQVFDLNSYLPTKSPRWDYPFPNGYSPLVKLLEDKYQHPVVITNGAKQALGAAFYALKKMGRTTMGTPTPHWALIPPLADMHGLTCEDEHYHVWDSFLAVSPNNPNGELLDLTELELYCQYRNVPLIHDAAYYTHSYLPHDYQLRVLGDVQIFSASKMFGLSGLRLGWAVCSNETMYQHIQEYMEIMTVGVSILPQMFLYNLMSHMQYCAETAYRHQYYPHKLAKFEQAAFQALRHSKQLMLQVSSEVLEVPANLPETAGMFGFFKVGPQANFERAKINVADGSHFGVPGFVRINLAHRISIMEEIVHRLNSCQK